MRTKATATPALVAKSAYIGCAGWSVPKAAAASFPREGSHLQRYAARFDCVEINSSFYRPHRPATYARWAASVPDSFRFSVKMPRSVTHHARLVGVSSQLDEFCSQVAALGHKLGCVLVQLPPSLAFERSVASRFLAMLRRRHDGTVAVEPRHPSWFGAAADAVLIEYGASRVAADPSVVPAAADPGGDTRAAYFRLHGSPKIYYSTYPDDWLARLAKRLDGLHADGVECWCIFDNTALGAATTNALDLSHRLQTGRYAKAS
jgi:uncharacterized protein YecE (DUF72 family)